MAQNPLFVDVLKGNLGVMQMTLADFTDAEFLSRPVPGANNAAWQVGHLISAEAQMVNGCAGKEVVRLPAGFAQKYTRETASSDDAAKLGTKAELLELFQTVRTQTAEWVGTLTESDLAKPAPERMRAWFPTVGHLIHLFPVHLGMHVGQIQVLRRRLGKPVLF